MLSSGVDARREAAPGTPVPVSVSKVDPCADPRWATLINGATAGLFHSPPWLGALSDTYDFPIRAWIATDSAGAPLGGVPFCELDDLAGHRLVCLPFSDCADPLFSSPTIWQLLFDQLQSADVPVHLRCLLEDRVQPVDGLAIAARASWHRLSVTGSEDELWQRVAPPARRSIRQAERAGVKIRALHGAADREAFHRMHVALRKHKYRLLAQPPQFIQALEHRFQAGLGWHAMAAELDGRMIAATIYLRWGHVLYYKFNASELETLGVRPNHLLVWEGIRLARRLGCTMLDLGPSRPEQSGLVRFKRNFGADSFELRFLSWTPANAHQRTPGRRPLDNIIRLLTSPAISDEVTARAGAALYRFLA